MARLVWSDFHAKAIKAGVQVELPGGVIFSSKLRLNAICFCGKPFVLNVHCFQNNRGNSCGCLQRAAIKATATSKRTYKDIQPILKSVQLSFVDTYNDNDFIVNVKKNGAYRFLCRCGKIFGEKTSLKSVLSGNTKSCGCLHIEHVKSLTHHRTRIELAERMDELGIVPAFKRDNAILLNKEKVPFICKCGKLHHSIQGDLYFNKVKTCGCTSSVIELEIFTEVQKFAPDAIRNTRKVIYPKEIDIWIPSAKIGIEIDGLFWHGERYNGSGIRTYQLQKLNLIENVGRCLFLFEDEAKRKKEVVLNYIKSLLHQKKTIGARKCTFTYNEKECSEFTEQHHIQGSVQGFWIGLKSQDKIVATACFGPSVFLDGYQELKRYCVGDVSINGGLSKLIQEFWRLKGKSKIVTYSDKRISQGNIYKTVGFVKTGECIPRYWYWNYKGRDITRYHRFKFRKSELSRLGWLKDNETEWECMLRNGYDRVWDSGRVRWELLP